LNSQLQVFGERLLLSCREIAETETHERVGQQSLRFDRVVADFAQPVRTVVHALECRINFLKQAPQFRIFQGS
jgi:hypothetical protein